VCHENDGICNSANLITNAMAFANGIQGYFSGDHAYDFNPWRDAQPGNNFIHQDHQWVGFGPPLPLSIPTPWQLAQQDPTGFSQWWTSLMYQIGQMLDYGSWVDNDQPASPFLRALYQSTT
jgi:hypothetical protein